MFGPCYTWTLLLFLCPVHHHQLPGLPSWGQVVWLPLPTMDHCPGLLHRGVIIHLCTCLYGLPLDQCQGHIQTGPFNISFPSYLMLSIVSIWFPTCPLDLSFVVLLTPLQREGSPLFPFHALSGSTLCSEHMTGDQIRSKEHGRGTGQRLARKKPWQLPGPIDLTHTCIQGITWWHTHLTLATHKDTHAHTPTFGYACVGCHTDRSEDKG